jgi:hypothetical protein
VKQFGKPRRRWDEKIEMYLEEIGRKGVECIDLKKTALIWAITQQVGVIPYRLLGHPVGPTFKGQKYLLDP